ncbi:MAG: hypothetical protein WAW33_00350 [Minisyncoccia bacterium]
MSEDNFNDLSNEELVELTGKAVIGTPSGLEVQHAQAELTKRLMMSINNLNSSSTRYSEKLIDLTIILFVIGLLQLIVSIKTILASWYGWVAISLVVLIIIDRLIVYIQKLREVNK